VAEAVRARGVDGVPLAVQITDEESVRRAADAVLEVFPCVDILVNAAGVTVRGRFGATFGQAEYSASKGAVDSLTRSLAAQWAELGIRVNAVAPTFVETELTRTVLADETFAAALRTSIPMGRWADAADVVGPVIFLASPAAGFITGQILYLDGGLTARV
jgi:NAD(P)-dependent dehydrogenase (short-subunit alcohol dehydrogenase family)